MSNISSFGGALVNDGERASSNIGSPYSVISIVGVSIASSIIFIFIFEDFTLLPPSSIIFN
jgi:hypothetical protein